MPFNVARKRWNKFCPNSEENYYRVLYWFPQHFIKFKIAVFPVFDFLEQFWYWIFPNCMHFQANWKLEMNQTLRDQIMLYNI